MLLSQIGLAARVCALCLLALPVLSNAGEPLKAPLVGAFVGAPEKSPTESIRQEAERAQQELSKELGGSPDAPVTAMTAKRSRPNPAAFKTGDLIWPRKPNQYVPYDTQPTGSFAKDKAEWEREKRTFLERVSKDGTASDYERAVAAGLEAMTFERFHARYIGEGGDGELSAQGWLPYVGHVAMVFFKEDKPWVVEAIPGKVRTIAYEDWLKERGDEYVWHGRLKTLTEPQRAKLVAEMVRHDQKPYSFWNLNLADAGWFYCSKLMWYGIFQAIGLALDDDPEPRRFFWYSPKQMMKSRHIQMLYSPGDYGAASLESPGAAQKDGGAAVFDKSLEGKSCDVVFADCVKRCHTPELEACVQSCCCRFGGATCPGAPNCCTPSMP